MCVGVGEGRGEGGGREGKLGGRKDCGQPPDFPVLKVCSMSGLAVLSSARMRIAVYVKVSFFLGAFLEAFLGLSL